MQFSETHELTQSLEKTLLAFTDPQYFTRKYEQENATQISVLEKNDDGNQFCIKVQRTKKNDAEVPNWAKKFSRDTLVVIQEDQWDRSQNTGLLSIQLQGMPVSIKANMRLSETATGCRNELSWTIEAKVPLVGGKLEALIAKDIQRQSSADMARTNALLADY